MTTDRTHPLAVANRRLNANGLIQDAAFLPAR
jgi:hypothetical protein